MTSGLCNPKYYRGVVLEIRKSMEVREEGMEVQEEATHEERINEGCRVRARSMYRVTMWSVFNPFINVLSNVNKKFYKSSNQRNSVEL